MNRQQRRHQNKTLTDDIKTQFERVYNKQLNDNLEIYTQTMIHALILAMNSELGIGKDRGNKVLEEMNKLIANNSLEELKKRAIERKLL